MMYNSPGNVSSSSTATPGNPTIPNTDFYHRHPPFTAALPPPPSLPPFSGGCGGRGAYADEFPVRDERSPQWSYQETRDFIEIRAQVEWELTTFKGKRNLWEMVVNGMREKGYNRTIDQCKSKWKNLVNRYKAQEAPDIENCQQFPFLYELRALFTARDDRMNQPQLDTGIAPIKGKKRLESASGYQSYEERSEEQENEEDTDVTLKRKGGRGKRPKKENSGEHPKQPLEDVNNNGSVVSSIHEILGNFIKQQQRIDMQWQEAMEKHAKEREAFEQEWRQTMEKLEREKIMMEQAWREKEEQRRLREESRAEKRDALLTTLLNKLIDEENP